MKSPFHSVISEFSALREELGFVDARAAWTSNFVSLVRAVGSYGCVYLFARDERSGRGPLRADLWVGPVEFPDDRLSKLSAAFHVFIGESYESDPSFFKHCSRRAYRLLPFAEGLLGAAPLELKDPSFDAPRSEKYSAVMNALKNMEDDPRILLAAKLAQGIVSKSGTSLSRLQRALTPVEPDLIAQVKTAFPRLSEDPIVQRAGNLSSMAADALYARALASLSRARLSITG